MNLGNKIGMRSLLAGAALLIASTGAHAQATRTWVSGVGDDANPCSRTAPCKTFAGAISKTATGGVINTLDPGGYGAVTITKSITIEGSAGVESSILASGTTGVFVNGAGINVILRNLQIHGGNNPAAHGVNGVNYINGASLTIDNCDIQAFHSAAAGNGNGVVVTATADGTYRLNIINSRIHENGSGNDGGGVRLKPTGANTFVFATIRNSDVINNNGYGVLSRDRTFVTVSDSNVSSNRRSGVGLLTTGTIGMTIVSDSLLADNGADNSGSEAGITANGAASIISITGNTIVQSENGLRRLNGGHINSSGDNRVGANTANGTTDGSMTSL
jgi:hypothetical protein